MARLDPGMAGRISDQRNGAIRRRARLIHGGRMIGGMFALLFGLTAPLVAAPSGAMSTPASANPIAYVELPVHDLDRATAFYTALLGLTFERKRIDGYEMALFPAEAGAEGASGALVRGDVYVPAKAGAIVYFRVAEIDPTLARARTLGAKILYEKKAIGPAGFVAEVEDSEGNRIALIAPR